MCEHASDGLLPSWLSAPCPQWDHRWLAMTWLVTHPPTSHHGNIKFTPGCAWVCGPMVSEGLSPAAPRVACVCCLSEGEYARICMNIALRKTVGTFKSNSAFGVRVLNLLWHNYVLFVYDLRLGFFWCFSHSCISNHHWDFSRTLGDCITFSLPHTRVFSWAALNKMVCTRSIL